MTPISARRALLAGLAAYTLWGLFPPYFSLLAQASALEILAHRVIWSFLSVLVVLLALRTGWDWVRADVLRRHRLPRLALAAALIGLNWLTYIWAVNSGHVVEASMGYFINPLVNVVLGVLIFGETFGLGGRLGASLALVGVVVISWGHWGTLWISLLLAFTFASYGVAKKKAHLPALEGLLVESALLLPLALGYLAWLAATGGLQFGTNLRITLLLASSGAVTALPLWLFAIAAPRVSFGVLGILQYVGPTLQFLFAIFLFHEPVSLTYWIGLVLIWIGSAIYLALTLRANAAPADAPEPV